MNQLLIFAALLATTLAYGRYRPNYHPLRESTPYEFEYDVNDGDNQHGHRQRNDGRVTSGSYRVALPDGRTQIVTYRADDNGYNADVTYEEPDYNPYRHPAPQSYYPPAPPSYYPPAPTPLIFRAPSHYQPAAPLPKPLIFRAAPSHTSPAAPEPNRPFYTSPAVPPFGAPAIQDYVAPVPLLFRNNVAYQVTPHAEYMDRIPLEYRSAFAKRSLPVDLWNESSILEVLPSPAEVEADVNVVEDEASSATRADDVQVEAAVESSKAYASERSDYATLDEAEEPLPNAEDVEVREVRSHSPSGNSDVIEFDDLPFPLPLPLAFRPYV